MRDNNHPSTKNLGKIYLSHSESSDDLEQTVVTPQVLNRVQFSSEATQFSSGAADTVNMSDNFDFVHVNFDDTIKFNSEYQSTDSIGADNFLFDTLESPNLKLCKTLVHEVFKLGDPILNNQLLAGETLGQGQFGKVIQGNLLLSENKSQPACWKIANTLDINVMMVFLKEAKILASLSHPFCLKSLGLSIIAGEGVALVTNLLMGGDLDKALFNSKGSLDLRLFFKISLQLIEAVRYLHGLGVIHRDIKPANILLTSSLEDDPDIRLADFGGSFFPLVEQDDPSYVGTFRYMAPEVRTNTLQKRESDIYSIGCVVYELFSSKKVASDPMPLEPNQNSFLPESVPFVALINSLLKDCWSENIANRPSADMLHLHFSALQMRSQFLENVFNTKMFQIIESCDDTYLNKFLLKEGGVELWRTHEKSWLWLACYFRNISLVEFFLNNNTSVNGNYNGWSPLLISCFLGEVSLAMVLLNAGAVVNELDPLGRSPIYYACIAKHYELLTLLLEVDDILPDRAASNEQSPLYRSVIDRNEIAFNTLLASGASVDHRYMFQASLLHILATDPVEISRNALMKYKDITSNMFRALKSKKVDINGEDQFGQTPLFLATLQANSAIAEQILQIGGNELPHSIELKSSLHEASRKGLVGIVNLLLDAGMDVNALDGQQMTAFLWAALYGRIDMMKCLLENEADVTISLSSDGSTALHLATNSEHLETLQWLLLNCSMLVNMVDSHGRSPLHWACWKGLQSCAEALLQAGADPVLLDTDGKSILYYAAEGSKNPELIEYLIQYLSRDQILQLMNSADPEKNTLVHYAATQGRCGVIRALIKMMLKVGIDPEVSNKFNYTPLHMAVKYGHLEAAALLINEYHMDPYYININGDNAIHNARRFSEATLATELQQLSLRLILKDFNFNQNTASEEFKEIMALISEAHYHFNDCYSKDIFKRFINDNISLLQESDDTQFQQFYAYQMGRVMPVFEALIDKTEQAYPILTCYVLLEKSDFYLLLRNYRKAMGLVACAKAYYESQFPANPSVLFKKRLMSQIRRVIIYYRQNEVRLYNILPELETETFVIDLQEHRHRMRGYIELEQFEPYEIAKLNTIFFRGFFARIILKVLICMPYPIEEILKEFAVIGLAEIARKEMNLYSSIEFAVILNNENKMIGVHTLKQSIELITRFIQLFVIALCETPLACLSNKRSPVLPGFRFFKNDIEFLNQYLVGSIQTLLTLQQGGQGSFHNLRSKLRTFTYIYGNESLSESYGQELSVLLKESLSDRKQKKKKLHHEEAITMLASDEEVYNPQLIAERKKCHNITTFQFDREFYLFPTHCIENLALYYDVQGKNTLERLINLKKKKVLNKKSYLNLLDFFKKIMMFRLRMHCYYEYNELMLQRSIKPYQNEDNAINTKRVYMLLSTDIMQLTRFFQILLPLHKTVKAFLKKAEATARVSKGIFHSANLKISEDEIDKEEYGLFRLS